MFSRDDIEQVRKKIPWSLYGFLITALGIMYAIYVGQVKQDKTSIIFEILANTQVLNLNEDLNELEILYKGENLKKNNESLILVTLRILNDGERDIVESDFYSQLKFGFEIINGKVADKPQIIDTSNDFLMNNQKLTYDSTNTVFFNKTQLDRRQYFTVKVLTICSSSELPIISPIGKISGMSNKIIVKNIYLDKSKEKSSFVNRVIDGYFGVHVARFFYYLIVIFLTVFVIVFPITKLSDKIELNKKRKILNKYKAKFDDKLSKTNELILELYNDYDEFILIWLDELINDKKRFSKFLEVYENRNKEIAFIKTEEAQPSVPGFYINSNYPELHRYHSGYSRILEKLLEKKIIVKKGTMISILENFRTDLRDFIKYIEIK